MRRTRMMDRLMRRDERMPYDMRRGMMPRRDRGMRDTTMMREDYRGYEDERYDRHHEMPSHYERGRGHTYYPIEAMGTFNGYYGMPEDYGMRHYRDYRYDYDSGMLEDEDIEHWMEKLKHEVEEKDKQFFTKETIKRKAMEMGIKFDKFTLEEFMVTAMMVYTDYCKTLGTANMEIYLRLAKDWLHDEDAAVKYGEKLAAYYDYIVEGEE